MESLRVLMSKSPVALVVLAALTLLPLTGCQNAQEKARKEGLAMYHEGNFAGALTKFNDALTYNEFDAKDNYYAGMSAFEMGKYEQAAYHLKLAWQADPGYPEVKQALTETLIRQGKPDMALDFLERDAQYTAKVKDPREQRTVQKRRYVWETEERMYLGKAGDRLRIAQAYETIGDYDNAKIHYEKARDMAPKDVVVLMNSAKFYERIGDKAAAAELLKKVYAIEPTTPGLVDAMTRCGLAVSEVIK